MPPVRGRGTTPRLTSTNGACGRAVSALSKHVGALAPQRLGGHGAAQVQRGRGRWQPQHPYSSARALYLLFKQQLKFEVYSVPCPDLAA